MHQTTAGAALGPEADAEAIYRLARCDPSTPAVLTVAQRLLGVRPQRQRMAAEAALMHICGRWHLWIGWHVMGCRVPWLVGHELAHWWLRAVGRDRGLPYVVLEDACDRLGAALAVPRAAVERAARQCGNNPHQLARAIPTCQSLALLRLGEVQGVPSVLVTPELVRVRGAQWGWPREPVLRKWAAMTPRRARILTPPGVCKVEITDEPRRAGLLVGVL